VRLTWFDLSSSNSETGRGRVFITTRGDLVDEILQRTLCITFGAAHGALRIALVDERKTRLCLGFRVEAMVP
jgi:hypothetical protein